LRNHPDMFRGAVGLLAMSKGAMITHAELPVIEIQTVSRGGDYVTYDVTVDGRPWGRYDEYEQAVGCSVALVRAAIRKLEAC
jgi:hypothetical protein